MAKRVFLFIATNLLIFATISIVINLLGLRPYITSAGLDYGSLFMFCLVWGMTGSFISLALSRKMAKWMMGVQVLTPGRAENAEWLVQMVHDLAKRASLPKMPEVGIYESPDANAFATGPTKSRALVAVSSGLIRTMNRDQIQGVLGHEISHISNGDMVTLTLISGIVNSFSLFLSRVIAYLLSQNVREESRYMVQMLTTFAFDILLSILGSMVVAWFSRQREFRADKGSAKLLGSPTNMISALQALQGLHGGVRTEKNAFSALQISGKEGGFFAFLATHPPLSVRIEALQAKG